MQRLSLGRAAIVGIVTATMIAACGSGPPIAVSGSTISALRTCRAARDGAARCGIDVRGDLQPSGAHPSGYGPTDLQSAYNLPSSKKGQGQIVAVIDAYDNPNVASDLAAYRSAFGLPTADFHKYNQQGQQGDYPSGDTGWGVQIDADAELVSASCPLCTIDLIEANSSAWSDIGKAADEAVSLGAHIVSVSAGGDGAQKKYFDNKGVTYLASAGDNGGVGEPASFDSVVAVGGTTLKRNGSKRGWAERAWSVSGGCTTQPKPRWQHDTTCAYRLANDVSAVADPSTGVAEYDTYGSGGWFVVGGTSVPTPLLAGVFGLAGNATQQDGGRTFWEKKHYRHLYTVKSGGRRVRYSTAAGWGTPDGIGAF